MKTFKILIEDVRHDIEFSLAHPVDMIVIPILWTAMVFLLLGGLK